MMVPERTSAQRGSLLRVRISGGAPAFSMTSSQPRRSRWSIVTTSSNQSPPLPWIVPQKLSVPRFFRKSTSETALYSFRMTGAGGGGTQTSPTSSQKRPTQGLTPA